MALSISLAGQFMATPGMNRQFLHKFTGPQVKNVMQTKNRNRGNQPGRNRGGGGGGYPQHNQSYADSPQAMPRANQHGGSMPPQDRYSGRGSPMNQSNQRPHIQTPQQPSSVPFNQKSSHQTQRSPSFQSQQRPPDARSNQRSPSFQNQQFASQSPRFQQPQQSRLPASPNTFNNRQSQGELNDCKQNMFFWQSETYFFNFCFC